MHTTSPQKPALSPFFSPLRVVRSPRLLEIFEVVTSVPQVPCPVQRECCPHLSSILLSGPLLVHVRLWQASKGALPWLLCGGNNSLHPLSSLFSSSFSPLPPPLPQTTVPRPKRPLSTLQLCRRGTVQGPHTLQRKGTRPQERGCSKVRGTHWGLRAAPEGEVWVLGTKAAPGER